MSLFPRTRKDFPSLSDGLPVTKPADSRREMIAKLGLLLFGGIFSLLIAESGLRLHYQFLFRSVGTEADLRAGTQTDQARRRVRLADMVRPTDMPDLIYDIKPNLDVVFRNARVVTNEAGYRGPQVPLAKKPGTIRIVGIGDSYMWGWGVKTRSATWMCWQNCSMQVTPTSNGKSSTWRSPGTTWQWSSHLWSILD